MICWPIDIVWIIGFTFQSMFCIYVLRIYGCVRVYVRCLPLHLSHFWQTISRSLAHTLQLDSTKSTEIKYTRTCLWFMSLHPFSTKSQPLFRFVYSFWLSLFQTNTRERAQNTYTMLTIITIH